MASRLFVTLISSCLLMLANTHAETVPFGEFSLGIGVQSIEDSDGESHGAVSQLTKVGVGVEVLPMLSLNGGVWVWEARESSSDEGDQDEQRIEFNGVSLGWDATLKLPFPLEHSSLSGGPYVRFGRHCWSAVVDGLVKPWAKQGCSVIRSLGVVLPTLNEQGAVVYFEFTDTDFDTVESDTLQVGVLVPY